MSITKPADIHIKWSNMQNLVLMLSPLGMIYNAIYCFLENKHLRLIHNGRLLDDITHLNDYQIGNLPVGNSKREVPEPAPVFIHRSLSNYTSKQRSTRNQPQLLTPLGFDRLTEAGLSEENVRNIHRKNESSEQAIYLDEQWMDSTGETLLDGTVHSTSKELVYGLMLVFFLGAIKQCLIDDIQLVRKTIQYLVSSFTSS
ncbi:hypothetical protein BCR42DRAFT_475246 [Absidia repens]|uniref:Ubiquitin-like domain-containing protein n=1 Tax=Absidia repens TaxID=90262 RepID=A0A1X2IT68_9FUNG|nr:hypothetical protein BCR42DRAFT_475246 [Absidia repens]